MKDIINLRNKYPLLRRSIIINSIVDTIFFILILFITILFITLLKINDTCTFNELLLALRNNCFSTQTALVVLGFIIVIVTYEMTFWERFLYSIVNDILIIQRGVFGSSQINIEINKINEIYVNQGIFDKLFNSYYIKISTASEQSLFSSKIDGLNEKSAISIKNEILNKLEK